MYPVSRLGVEWSLSGTGSIILLPWGVHTAQIHHGCIQTCSEFLGSLVLVVNTCELLKVAATRRLAIQRRMEQATPVV